jgi:hypothetical protein
VTAANGVVLDAGAFIALQRRDRVMVSLVEGLAETKTPLVTSAGVVAQVWRGGGNRQAPVAFLLRRATVVDLTDAAARLIGRMLGARGGSDAVDGHVVLLARERRWPVLTSDPADLLAIDPTLTVQRV